MTAGVDIVEFKDIDLEGGYLIDGCPSVGFSGAIATESILHTSSDFEQVGIMDSESLPPISVVHDGMANYPIRLFVNKNLKVGIISSHLIIPESLHRPVATQMIKWAKRHSVSLVVSGMAAKMPNHKGGNYNVLGAASSNESRDRLKSAGIDILSKGVIPGIPGCLLNDGTTSGQDVLVLLFRASFTAAGTGGASADFKASIGLCNSISRIIPGISCDTSLLKNEAKKAKKEIMATKKAGSMRDSMYG